MTKERYKAAQILEQHQHQVIILSLQSISSKEVLHNKQCRSNYKAAIIYNQNNRFYTGNWHKYGPKDSPKHFMCTVSHAMELVRNHGQVGCGTHRILLGQHDQAIESRIS